MMLSVDERKFKEAKQAFESVQALKGAFALIEFFWKKLNQISTTLDEQNKEISELKKEAKKNMKLISDQDREIFQLKRLILKRTN